LIRHTGALHANEVHCAVKINLSNRFEVSYLRTKRFQQKIWHRVRVMSSVMDRERAFLRTHQQNIERYQRLLKTKLTDLETQFLEKRLTEERFWLAMLTTSSDLSAASEQS
jgi:hypothetical protein